MVLTINLNARTYNLDYVYFWHQYMCVSFSEAIHFVDR